MYAKFLSSCGLPLRVLFRGVARVVVLRAAWDWRGAHDILGRAPTKGAFPLPAGAWAKSNLSGFALPARAWLQYDAFVMFFFCAQRLPRGIPR
jgi:hypothetical protein